MRRRIAQGCYSQNSFSIFSPNQETETGSKYISDSEMIHANEIDMDFEQRVYCVGYQSFIAY
jgi:hypothetical protein